jgi:hypothetical protein
MNGSPRKSLLSLLDLSNNSLTVLPEWLTSFTQLQQPSCEVLRGNSSNSWGPT